VHTSFDPKVLGGSIQKDIVNPDLIEERSKTAFDKVEFNKFFLGEDVHVELKEIADFIAKRPDLH